MIPKIRYRLVYNYANRLNRHGQAPVSLECRQGQKKFYLTSNVMLGKDQWEGDMVVNHPNADKLNVYLYKWKSEIEEIELNALLEKTKMTLRQLKDAVKHNVRTTATIRQFVEGVILTDEGRKKSTKINYQTFLNEFERMYGDKVTIEDITTDFVLKFRSSLRQNHSENTVKGRLKMLRTIVSEALKRRLLKEDAFLGVTIGNMTPRKTYLTFAEIDRIEKLCLKKKRESHVKDAFLWCCCVGLRYSDFVSLKDEDIVDGVLNIVQQKTGEPLTVPLKHLFGGKPLEILSRYKSVRDFARIGDNANANRIIQKVVKEAGIDKKVSWHCSRHTAGTLLNQSGLKMQEIQKILGHSQLSTTANIYAMTTQEQVDESLKKAFGDKE